MASRTAASVNCPNCGNAFTASIQQIVDTREDPEAKSRLLSGQLNTVGCPNCGFQGALNAPFLYHDPELELAFVYVPMELGESEQQRQQLIGDLTNRLMDRLPPGERKGYLLQPRVFLSLESLIDAMLEEDEETREMVEAQRRKMELLDQLRQMDPQDSLALAEFVGSHDEELDTTFFDLLDMTIDVAESQGDVMMRERLAKHQEQLLERTTTGQIVKAQQAAVEALAADPTRESLIEQLIAAEDRAVREALITVGRQLLDYAFFQSLTQRVEAAEAQGDTATKEKLIALRKEIQEIRDQVDEVAMSVLETRAELLQELLLAEDPKELAMHRLSEIDAVFFNILSSNIYQAQQQGRDDVAQALREIGDVINDLLNEIAPPHVRLLNRLVTAQDEKEVRQLLEQEQDQLDTDLLEFMREAARDLDRRGRSKGAERLRRAVEQAEALISA